MLIPHIKFIESLVVSKFDIDKIKNTLEEYLLSCPEEALAIIIKTIQKTKPKFFKASNKEPIEVDWVQEELDVLEGFGFLNKRVKYLPKHHSLEGAVRLLSDPLMYRLVTCMALANITDEDIELLANIKFNQEYGPDDIKLFLKYFFNTVDWSRKDKQQFVGEVTEPKLSHFYKIALKGDKEFLMWKLGVNPDKDFKEMLNEMIQDSYFNFKEQSKVKPDVAQRWAGLAIKLTDRIEGLDKKEEKSMKSLLDEVQFNIKTYSTHEEASKPIKHFKDLE